MNQENWDPAAAERLIRQGGERLLAAVVRSFLERTPARLTTARTALADGDLETVHREAHTLKTSVRMMGAARMGELCERVETLAEEGPAAELPSALAELEQEFAAIRPSVEALRSEEPTP